ncbi:S-adenosyl-L-methionine-dependent methyltransferase [Gigaspora margarita]|uniref:S-adenosyl-L-methionine-dependent methyltransferase n=1 Tax=Gigaspora margarita TaxID=4874 RepID=A0A8H4AI99_GIGMA|nr:S-adenosyl-L-methionine-dependent methyltransferase [Gigaspora margarita]
MHKLYIGCSAGSWSFDIATTYPLVEIVGLDMFPIQPTQIKPKISNSLKQMLWKGGFLELSEPSKMLDLGPATQHLFNGQLLEQGGLDSDIYQKLDNYLQNQGQLENIKKEVKQCYHGVKSNDIKLSKVVVSNMVSAYESFKPVLLKLVYMQVKL